MCRIDCVCRLCRSLLNFIMTVFSQIGKQILIISDPVTEACLFFLGTKNCSWHSNSNWLNKIRYCEGEIFNYQSVCTDVVWSVWDIGRNGLRKRMKTKNRQRLVVRFQGLTSLCDYSIPAVTVDAITNNEDKTYIKYYKHLSILLAVLAVIFTVWNSQMDY